jgi:hypothetical protein
MAPACRPHPTRHLTRATSPPHQSYRTRSLAIYLPTHLAIYTTSAPERPFTSSATRPLVSCASDSPCSGLGFGLLTASPLSSQSYCWRLAHYATCSLAQQLAPPNYYEPLLPPATRVPGSRSARRLLSEHARARPRGSPAPCTRQCRETRPSAPAWPRGTAAAGTAASGPAPS